MMTEQENLTAGAPAGDQAPPLLQARRLSKNFGSKAALHDVDIELPRGASSACWAQMAAVRPPCLSWPAA